MDRIAIAETFLRRLGEGKWESVAEVLDPNVQMQTLLPGGARDYRGREEVTDRLRWWFGTGQEATLLHSEARPAADRVELGYGFRILDAEEAGVPGWRTIEQRAFCDIGDSIEKIDLVCSGFRPVDDPSTNTHQFDAGDMGCADGLPQEFRRWIRSIEPGDVLQVVTKDPAAKEDLPSLARLMGNTVKSIETLDDGRLLITVERGK